MELLFIIRRVTFATKSGSNSNLIDVVTEPSISIGISFNALYDKLEFLTNLVEPKKWGQILLEMKETGLPVSNKANMLHGILLILVTNKTV